MAKNNERRTYFLFVHYGIKGGLDNNKKKLKKDLEYLGKILGPTDIWEGHAFVYIDLGFRELIRGVISTSEIIRLAEALVKFLTSITIPKNITPVTVLNLNTFIEELENVLPKDLLNKLYRFIVSGTEQSYYDGPKIVEAILRIANIGRNTPIFRFDDDVIFYGSRSKMSKKDQTNQEHDTRGQILKLCQHYDDLCKDSQINYFVFSGGYCDPAFIKMVESNKKQFDNSHISKFLNGYATRVVQLADTENAHEEYKKLLGSKELNSLEPETVLNKVKVKISTKKIANFLNELSSVGANPFRQAISGAGFCLSDGAILDLPPFSNMRQNVMWIDDHLKYALHHELRHFGFKRGTQQIARSKDIYFNQSRHLPENPPTLGDVRWHMRDYLPRLILGCIADSWLRQNKNLKQSFVDLSNKKVDALLEGVPGTYAKYFIKNVGSDSISHTEFSKDLWKLAYIRLSEIIKLFSENKYNGTFLQLFILGPTEQTLHGTEWEKLGFFTEFAPKGLKEAFERLSKTFDGNLNTPDNSSGYVSLEVSLKILIEDFIDYIEFVGLWRHFIFCVRSLLNWQKKMSENIEWLLPGVLGN